jgi:hypothetical protein
MLRGQIFEGYAHRCLQKGGSFPARGLDTDFNGEFEIPNSKAQYLESNISNWHLELGFYYIPIARNFAAIDAILLPKLFYQMTVSARYVLMLFAPEKLK